MKTYTQEVLFRECPLKLNHVQRKKYQKVGATHNCWFVNHLRSDIWITSLQDILEERGFHQGFTSTS